MSAPRSEEEPGVSGARVAPMLARHVLGNQRHRYH